MVDLADTLQMKINIYISATNLKRLDMFSKSDPYCVVYEFVKNQWNKVGKTECISNNQNPNWITSI